MTKTINALQIPLEKKKLLDLNNCFFREENNVWEQKKESSLYLDNLKRILFLLHTIVQANEKILFLASDEKYSKLLKKINSLTSQPYFIGKWMGGYLTNFDKIKSADFLEKKKEKKISCIVVLDPMNSSMAIQEAVLLNIPIICFIDNSSRKKKMKI